MTGFVWLISKCFLNYPALSVVWNYISFFTVFYRFVGIGRVELERESGVGRRPSSAQLQSRPHARDVVHVRRQSRRRLLRRSRRRLSNVSRLRPSRREWRKSHLHIKQQQHAVVVVVVIDKWKVLSLLGIKIWIPGKGTRSSYILIIMNWLICVKYFSNIRERGKFTTGAQFVSTKQVNLHESRAPPNFVCTGTLVDYGSYCYYYTGVQRAKVKGKKQKIIFFTLRVGGKLTHCFRACCLWARPII